MLTPFHIAMQSKWCQLVFWKWYQQHNNFVAFIRLSKWIEVKKMLIFSELFCLLLAWFIENMLWKMSAYLNKQNDTMTEHTWNVHIRRFTIVSFNFLFLYLVLKWFNQNECNNELHYRHRKIWMKLNCLINVFTPFFHDVDFHIQKQNTFVWCNLSVEHACEQLITFCPK